MGTAEIKFVITVAAQKLICPHGKTYPIKEVIIIKKKIKRPEAQTLKFEKEYFLKYKFLHICR